MSLVFKMRIIFRVFVTAVFATSLLVGLAFGQDLAPRVTDQVYADTEQDQIWSDENYAALLGAIESLSDDGLNPEQYGLSSLRSAANDAAVRDRPATSAWLMAAAHLSRGKTDPKTLEPSWTIQRRSGDYRAALNAALVSGEIGEGLQQFAPTQPVYAAMKAELARLAEIAESPVASVSDGPALKEGQAGARVAELQARLVQLGWLAEVPKTPSFDALTLEAVEAFQASEGLDADGVVGAASLRALNRGPQARISQLRVNMERFRWLPDDLGRRHLRANIAGFEVTAYEDGIPVRTHLTIVGKPYRATPVFSDEVEYIDFNPWWETPSSLARADKLPLFQRDPGAVERLGFQVLNASGQTVNASSVDWNSLSRSNFPYRIRQAPGPQNALGQVKIMFPNEHNVYLHDTPTRGLFAQRQRAFSSGCLRTQHPIELSKWLLEETDGWDAARIDTVVTSGKETRVHLSSKVPVHILYSTVVSDGATGVRFLDDIYQRDPAVLAGLRAPPQ